jgi:hypothetical protein
MSRLLGNSLPPLLQAQLDGKHLEEQRGQAIQITTVDPSGWPHPALVSYAELLALSPHCLRLAVYHDGQTADNLRRDGRLTLCFVQPDLALYVKAHARLLPTLAQFPKLAAFELWVELVLEDFSRSEVEGTAQLASGITFRLGADAVVQGDRAQQILNALAHL